MPKKPEPWWREDRQAWFVQIDRKRYNLGKDKKAAWQRYYELMAQPKQRAIISTDSLLPIMDAFLDWCQKHRAPDTYEWYRWRLERFGRKYPDLTVGELRPYHVQQWIDGTKVSSGSRKNFCRSIKRCVRWAKQQGYIDQNPIADMEMPKGGKREVVLSDSQWQTILSLVPDHSFRDLLIVTWETGCRPQESLRVEARHVDLVNQRWVFPESESKTDIPRVVYLTDEVLAITKRLMQRYPQGPLFRNTRGKPWTPDAANCAFQRIQIKQGQAILDRRCQGTCTDGRRKYLYITDAAAARFAKTLAPCKQSGREKITAELMHEARKKLGNREAMKVAPKYCLYDLRHTWMNRLLTSGVDSLTVAFLAGHSDPSTLAKVYAHLSQNPSYLLSQAKKAAG